MDAPSAFGRSLREEEALSEESWQATARTPIFVAILDGAWVGMTGCSEETPGGPAMIWGMWVVPDARRTGFATRLLEAALGWARAEGWTQARLWVTETNQAATELYRRAGFKPTGRSKPLRSHPSLLEVEMERSLP
jgi:GNAT superfamily N-acetyltransferase